MRGRLVPLGALIVLGALATGLVLALVHGPAGGRVAPGRMTTQTRLSPRDPQFGDTVVAVVDVFAGRVDPDGIRSHSSFGPYEVVSRTRSVRGSSVRFVARLRCLEARCVPGGAVKTFRFAPASVTYPGGSVRAGWPPLRVHSRVTRAALATPVVRVPPPAAAPARYRLPPTATGIVLLVLAALLAAGGAFLLLRVALRRIHTERRDPPLERVLAELASCSNGDSGRRRRALEQLARELEPLHDQLSAESRVLAWRSQDPQPEAVSELTDRVRAEVPS
jgi:hypothetical protein